ncbi:unnamed protein product [Brachionus calyciflorus]|uniref:mitogen-activated protein kinase kinase n=1 Tax=Brachionus calyciflorus TaxID=104777 RepID=A0A814BN59_9BILA|nr:unnamed protein product [Brachionus calyciflorus]
MNFLHRKNKKIIPSNDTTTTSTTNPTANPIAPPSLSISVTSVNSTPLITKPSGLSSYSNTATHSAPSSSSNNFSLPLINTPNIPKHSNSELLRPNLGLNFNNQSGMFSSSFSSLKTAKDTKNKLDNVKNFWEAETENNRLRINFDSQLSSSSGRPSVLTPINVYLPETPVPRARRDNLKFEFGSGNFSDQKKNGRPHELDLSTNEKVHFDLIDKSPRSNSQTPLSLQIPSSRSTSASSVSLSSSTNSLHNSMQYRLEAANSDKYKEIIANAGFLLINDKRIRTTMNELNSLCELGSGTCGHVYKMIHQPTGFEMAVKQMCISGIVEENKRIIMDLDVVAKSHNCKYIVKCLGYFISESDVWICMELMSMCFDKLLKLNKGPIPENILGKLTVSILQALNYLKEKHSIIHRDIKPSNILIDENGDIKLCDFGISGNLINSKALSRNNTGCAGYLSPERIDYDPNNPVYDIRADVWSLGITLVELATGEYPYRNCSSEFEVMTCILSSEPPVLIGDQFSEMFKSFISSCLKKDVSKRPKYNVLLKHEFVKYYSETEVDVKSWLRSVLEKKNKPQTDSKPIVIEVEEKQNIVDNQGN